MKWGFDVINIKFLRGTKAQNDAYIGKVGTVTLDLTDKSLRVHDGVTAGGKKIPNTTAVEQLIENYLFLHANSGDHDSRYYTQTQVDNKIANISSYDDSGIRTLIDGKVDKITGKGLSTNDFTNVLSDKLNTIESGAEKNVGTNLGLSGTGNTKTLTSSTGSNVSLPVSTTTNAGLMSTGDKTKLNSVEAGAEVNVGTSLGSSRNATSYTVTSSTGNNTSLASASTTAAGVMSASDKTKLDGVATGAEVNTVTSVAGKDGDVSLSKSDVGLGLVDNTSDASKPVSTAQQNALNNKVDVSAIVNGLVSTATTQPLSANQGRVLKGYVDAINDVLQSNDGTLDELQEIVDYIKANRSTLEALGISNIAGLQSALNAKVDVVAGKGLSSNDYTDSEKSKLSSIASGAEVNVGTNLGLSGTGNARTLTSSTGGNVSLPTATTTNAGLMATSDKSKLNGMESGATGDQTKADIDALGVDADTLDGKHASAFYEKTAFSVGGTANTPVLRDGSADISARLFKTSFNSTNSDIQGIFTTRVIGGDYVRPSTPSQVKTALNIGIDDVSGLSDAAATTVSTIRSGTTKADVGLGAVRNVASYSQVEVDTNFAAKTHNHSATDITSGTLSKSRLPTIDHQETSFSNQFVGTGSSVQHAELRLGGAANDGINSLQVVGGARADTLALGAVENAQESIDTDGNINVRGEAQVKMGNFSMSYNNDTESLDFNWIGG